jgi:hypothetical protein
MGSLRSLKQGTSKEEHITETTKEETQITWTPSNLYTHSHTGTNISSTNTTATYIVNGTSPMLPYTITTSNTSNTYQISYTYGSSGGNNTYVLPAASSDSENIDIMEPVKTGFWERCKKIIGLR